MSEKLTKSQIIEKAKTIKYHCDLFFAIEDAENGNKAALAYLRGIVEPRDIIPHFNEDGPCAGFGCEAILLQ